MHWYENGHPIKGLLDTLANKTASLPNWPFILSAAVIAIVGQVCIHRWRDKVAARSRFRDTLIEMRARVINDSLSVNWVKDSMGGQEAAIIGFLRHVRKRDRVGFDAACEKYRKLRQPQQMMIGVGFSEKQRCELVDVIDRLLSYADKIKGVSKWTSHSTATSAGSTS